MTSSEIMNKAMDLIHKQSDKLDEYEKQLNERWDEEWDKIQLSKEGTIARKWEVFSHYLTNNQMIIKLIEDLPDNIEPDMLTLRSIKIGIKQKPMYDEIYRDGIGLTRNELPERSSSLKRKDRDYKNFVREHKTFYLEQ